MIEMILEEHVVNTAVLAHGIEIEFRKTVAPLLVELFEANAARGRQKIRISATETGAVGIVTLYHVAHFTYLLAGGRVDSPGFTVASHRNCKVQAAAQGKSHT